MRFKIQLEMTTLPKSYRMYMLSFIKEVIQLGDEQLYKQLYEEGKKPKALTFSVFLNQFQLKEEQFILKNGTLTFSTSNPMIGIAFLNGINAFKTRPTSSYTFKVGKVEVANEKPIQSNVAKFQILNAILLEDKQHKPLLISDSHFEEEFNIITDRRFKALYDRPLIEPIQIIHHQLKKQVIQETNRHSAGKTLFFTGQKGMITLKGNPKDLTLLYKDGCLLRASQGFGSLEVMQCYDENYY